MTVLAPPRHPMVENALADAATWCTGEIIDDRPALAHAVKVAVTIGAHLPNPGPDLIAAALLHDSPDLAPTGIDLDQLLTTRYSATWLRSRLWAPDVRDFRHHLASTARRSVRENRHHTRILTAR